MTDSLAKIYKSNALIEAKYKLTVLEQRILLACMQQIDKRELITDEVMYTVTVEQIAKMADLDKNALYTELKEAADRLMRREVWISREPNGGKGPPILLFRRWTQACDYERELGIIRLRFSKDILPYINNLTREFTKYNLADVAKMDSIHALRLYELFIQYEGLGEREITVEEFQQMLVLGDSYKLMHNLKSRVLEPALKQINRLSNLTVSYRQTKRGRAIYSFIFKIEKKKCMVEEKQEQSIHHCMTDKQRIMFAGLLSTDKDFSVYAAQGETYEMFSQRIQEQLKDPEKIKLYLPYLEKHNFKF